MSRKVFTTLALAILTALPAAAVPATYTLDPAHSTVGFRIRHLVSKVPGSFKAFDAALTMDAEKPEASSVSFTIQAASIDTANENRDNHLRSDDFFAVEKFPQITFTSTSVKKLQGNDYSVTGNLTMRGVTKQVTLPVTYTGELKDPRGNIKAGFWTTVTLNRKDYGINWNTALDNGGFVLSDDVEVDVELAMTKK